MLPMGLSERGDTLLFMSSWHVADSRLISTAQDLCSTSNRAPAVTTFAQGSVASTSLPRNAGCIEYGESYLSGLIRPDR